LKNLSVRNALIISFGFIIVVWIFKVIRNTVFLDSVLALFKSMPHVFMEAFITAVLVIICVTFLLRLSKEKFTEIGFRKDALLKQAGYGILFGVLIFITDTVVINTILNALLPETSGQGIDMSKLFSNTGYIFIFLFIGIFKGGFSEELWRIFVLTRFEKLFGKPGLIIALILSSIIFGIGHLYQGLSGLISISIIGFMYALVYLRKRSALEAVLAHATENTISIILGYIVYSGA
jgi:membrane protease YdiL (CAAX protease family)